MNLVFRVTFHWGHLPSSLVCPSVVGEVVEGTGGSCLVSAVSCQGTGPPRTTGTRGKEKSQPRPKPSQAPDVMGYKEETKQNRFLCRRVRGKVLSLCTRQNIQVSKYSGGLLTLSPRRGLSCPGTRPGGGPWRALTSPSRISLYPT